MDLQKLMKQAQQMQAKVQATQASLSTRSVEASVGGGKVTVTATAAGDVTGITIDPSIVDPTDVEFLQELVLSGVQQAIEQGRAIAAAEMGKVSGGMGLPPGMGF